MLSTCKLSGSRDELCSQRANDSDLPYDIGRWFQGRIGPRGPFHASQTRRGRPLPCFQPHITRRSVSRNGNHTQDAYHHKSQGEEPRHQDAVVASIKTPACHTGSQEPQPDGEGRDAAEDDGNSHHGDLAGVDQRDDHGHGRRRSPAMRSRRCLQKLETVGHLAQPCPMVVRFPTAGTAAQYVKQRRRQVSITWAGLRIDRGLPSLMLGPFDILRFTAYVSRALRVGNS